MRAILAIAMLAALAGCCSPRKTWPPRPDWNGLDPSVCHPYPDCLACPRCAEWPGR